MVLALLASLFLTEADYQSLVTLHAPAITANATTAALVVSRVSWDADKRTNDLVVVDLRSGAQRTLLSNRPGLSDPAFSPDGTQLAFLADDSTSKDAHARVFVMPVPEGTPRAVSPGDTDAVEFAWRPDGKGIAYAAADPKPQRAGAERFRDSFVFTTEPITAREFPEPVHLFTAGLDGEAPEQLTFGSQSIADGSPISWSPDGRSIALTLCRNAILNDQSYSWIAVVDVANAHVRGVTGRSMWEGDARFSPDGKHIAYLYSDGDPQIALSDLYVTTPSGGPGTRISASLDRNISDFIWTADSQDLIATGPFAVTNALYRISLEGVARRIDVGEIVPGTPLNTTGGADAPSLRNALAADGTMVFLASATAQPLELFKYTPRSGASKVTDFNAAMGRFELARAQRIAFRTSTGVTADGVLYLPPSFSSSRRYPLVVFIHGGPGDPSMLEFDFWAQVMAARGWLVLRPNYRGSPNLGLAYQRAILYDPEDGPGKDVMAAIASVHRLGAVDTTRIAVCGWSYGGIMTAWLISRYHIWRAAVSGASVNDWITDYGTADDSLADVDMLHGSPFVGNNAAEWRRVSPIWYARAVTTPVLILSDTGDNRDPFATSSMYWRALRDNNKDATLRVWPVDGHFPGDPVRTVDVFHYWIEYLADHFR